MSFLNIDYFLLFSFRNIIIMKGSKQTILEPICYSCFLNPIGTSLFWKLWRVGLNPSFSKDKSLKGKRQTQPKYSNVGRMQPKYLDVKNFEQFHRKLIHADVCMKIYSEWFCSCLHCRCGVTYLCDQKLCEFCSSPVYTYTGNEPEIYYK